MAANSAATSEVELALLRATSVETIRPTPNVRNTEEHKTITWPGPRPLKSLVSTWFLCLPDMVLGLIALAYLTYGIVCLRTKGETLHLNDEWATGLMILQVTKFTPTIYPYLFAATVARCLKNIAKWRSEKGLSVGAMAQLLGSTTITNTAMVPWRLRLISPLMLALLAGWALSPLGSQASLRIISMEPRTRNSDFSLEVYQTNQSLPQLSSSDEGDPDLVFTAAMAVSNTTRNSSVDSWSNLFVPVIEEIEKSSNHDDNGWYRETDLDTVPHASLLGIPFTPRAFPHSASFTFVASYFHLTPIQYHIAKNVEGYRNDSSPGNWTVNGTIPITFSGWFDGPKEGPRYSPTGPQTIFVDGIIHSGAIAYMYSDLVLSWSFVEIQMTWDASSSTRPWHMTAVRRLNNVSSTDPDWTPLKPLYSFRQFFKGILDINILSGQSKVSVVEYYLNNPYDPFSTMGGAPNFTAITADQFCLRLAQIMNTYWMASTASKNAMSEINSYMKDSLPWRSSANASYHIPENYLACHSPWAEILIVCSIFLMAASIVSAICSALSNGPDILDTVSSLTRENMIDVPKGGTWMDGDERMRLLKNVVVVMGDAKPDADVGYIALSNRGGEGKLDRERFYE